MCQYCNDGDEHEDASGYGVMIPGAFGKPWRRKTKPMGCVGPAEDEDDDGT